MKRPVCLALLTAGLLLAAGCQWAAPAPAEAPADASTAPSPASATGSSVAADPYSPEAVYETYMKAYFHSIIASKDWSDPMELEPNLLVDYGMISLDQSGVELTQEGIPAQQLEKEVTAHFDVTADHLRRSSYYDEEQQLYVTGGYGGGATMDVTEVKREGDTLTVSYNVWVGQNEVVWGGQTTILLATSSDYRYIGNTTWDNREPAPALASAKLWQWSGEVVAWEWTFTDSETLAKLETLQNSGRWLPQQPVWPDGGRPIEFLLTDAAGKETAGFFHTGGGGDSKGYCPGQLGEQWQEIPEEKMDALVALLQKQGLNAQ